MENVMIDLDEVRKVVDSCDVFTIGFRIFPERMVVDTRAQGEEGPMIEVVEPVATVEERFFWLGKRRPNFGVPEQFTFFVWPHSIRYLRECGLADRIRDRLTAAWADAGEAFDAEMARVEHLERRAVVDAIVGKNHHTLWARGS
jgi:hypothetical protein